MIKALSLVKRDSRPLSQTHIGGVKKRGFLKMIYRNAPNVSLFSAANLSVYFIL
jgi:hypothetical protein